LPQPLGTGLNELRTQFVQRPGSARQMAQIDHYVRRRLALFVRKKHKLQRTPWALEGHFFDGGIPDGSPLPVYFDMWPRMVQCRQMPTSTRDDGDARSFRVYGAGDLGVAVRQFRLQAGLSQARLAELSGVHRSYLSELERGKTTEQLQRLIEILGILGVEVQLRGPGGS
jgi:HTH-type transcriptional regulator/antitoxin HipB